MSGGLCEERAIGLSVKQIGVEGSGQDMLIGYDCSLSVISKRDDSGVSGGAQRVFTMQAGSGRTDSMVVT